MIRGTSSKLVKHMLRHTRKGITLTTLHHHLLTYQELSSCYPSDLFITLLYTKYGISDLDMVVDLWRIYKKEINNGC